MSIAIEGLDIAGAVARIGGEVEDYVDFAEIFLEDADEHLQGLQTTLASGNAEADEEARKQMHCLRGAALAIGAENLVTTLQTYESQVKSGQSLDRDLASKDITTALEETIAKLNQAVAAIQAG